MQVVVNQQKEIKMFRTNGTTGENFVANMSESRGFVNRHAELVAREIERVIASKANFKIPELFMRTDDLDDLPLGMEDADGIFTNEMVSDFKTGRAFSLGC
jgi:hypothetical protein